MTFLVRFDPRTDKYLDKLPDTIARRIVLKMRWVASTGRGIEPLRGSEFDSKIRIGDYRVFVDVTYEPNVIWVRHIDHRRRAYK